MAARELLLLLACACVRGSVITAKEYICKDPDTGSLHVVNTTWQSTTFCGNYYCGLRKVGHQGSKMIINVTSPHARTPHNKDDLNSDTNNDDEFSLSRILPEISKDNDRLLNKDEIQKITELLHTVKKSDLQAVIELYNVAQDIYKEMDSDTKPQKDLNAAENNSLSESKIENPSNIIRKTISYFYEPEDGYRKGDMKSEGSEHRTTTTYPARSQYEHPYYYAQKHSQYPSYFTGSLLSNTDFGQVGYYGAATSFPSRESYPQRRNVYGASGAPYQTPCNSCPGPYQLQPSLPANVAGAYPQAAVTNMLQPYAYPAYNFSTQSYANYNNNYYKGNPWAYYDYYRNYPYTATAAQARNNPENSQDKIITDENEKSWRTDPLSDSVINEIRANIAERGKLINIPLKKRLKLERVAKVIKMDSFQERKTRSVSNMYDMSTHEKSNDVNGRLENEEQLETYIEKVTCEPPTEPGYFRMGNMTQPYPYCCPEKIEEKR